MVKSFKKIIIAVLALLLVVPVISSCGQSSAKIESEAREQIGSDTLETISGMLENNIAVLLVNAEQPDFEDYISSGQNYVNPAFDNSLNVRWKEFINQHGKVVNAELNGVEQEKEEYNGHIVLTGEDGEMMRLNIEINETCTPVSTTIEPYADDSKDTLGEKMGKAGLRTVTGLLVVFVVLVVLCLIISAFILIGKGGNRKKDKAAASEPEQKSETTVKEISSEKEVTDNSELVAVIAAAIAASEGVSTDGFVVRSIKRLGNNKW